MNDHRDLEIVVTDWLTGDAPTRASERVLAGALDRIGLVGQDRYVTQRLFGDGLGRSMPLRLAILLLASLLAVGTGLALLVIGSALTHDDFAVDPAHPIPNVLSGEFEAQLAVAGPAPGYVDYAWYLVDLDADNILHGPSRSDADIRGVDDATASWAGRAVAFVSTEPGAGELVIRASEPCGDARYHLLFDDEGITFTQPRDACADRVAILTSRPWRHHPTMLAVGERYGSWFFTEPFHFVLPQMEQGAVSEVQQMVGIGWSPATGRLRIGHPYWRTWFIDDQSVYADICDPSKGTLHDVPATPEAVGEWLRSSSGTTVSPPIELEVDGRSALRFDIRQSDACVRQTDPTSTDVMPIDGFRVYAIPTGDDTILYTAWTDGGSDIATGVDELVRSITFD